MSAQERGDPPTTAPTTPPTTARTTRPTTAPTQTPSDPSSPSSPSGSPSSREAPPSPSAAGTPPTAPPSILAAVGGPLGAAESSVPAAIFVAAYTISGQDTRFSVILAVAIGAALTVARVVRGQTLQFALSGLFGIALAGFIVSRTGRAEDFFLPGLLLNVAYAVAYLVSIAVRWPLIGVIVATMTGQGSAWRRDRGRMRAYDRASWIWVVLFLARVAVQAPLYLAGALVALGVAKVAMGIPLFALGIWLTVLLLRERPDPASA